MPADLTTLAKLIRETYREPFIEMTTDEKSMLGRFKHTTGRSDAHRWKVHHGKNTSTTSYGEKDVIGAAGVQSYEEASTPYRQNMVVVEVYGLTEAATAGSGGFMAAMASETKAALENLKTSLNDQILANTPAKPTTDLDGIGVILQDTGNYAGLARTNSWWKPYVLANGGTPRPLSIALMQDMSMTLATPVHRAKVSVIATAPAHWYQYGNIFFDLRRYRPGETLDGGFKALEFEGINIIQVPNMATGNMFFLDESVWEYQVLKDFESEPVATQTDSKKIFIKHYSQLVCLAPARNGRITDLSS
ncbi:phage major capsid protein [Nitrolancea hollandica]|uniref:Phage major capsid protein n=1 Tax=Nitrolancea hollandica Lb TaxID=1129897 RepID=I4EL50_9BACT|nr:phage major capsid protein [Nitrolancea hollandica]CCF85412.1 hypothetical protein NITHO_4930004 [Nitrolancea hollandica Lb]